MKNKYFKNSHQWSKNDIDSVGLPRPYDYTYRKDMARIVPIPWQSESNFKHGQTLRLNRLNESLVYQNDFCPFCGIKIEKTEITIRWKTIDIIRASETPHLVSSDYHPFHLECMTQARIFCPFIKTLTNEDFEIGLYKILKINAMDNLKKIEKIKNEKTIKKNL